MDQAYMYTSVKTSHKIGVFSCTIVTEIYEASLCQNISPTPNKALSYKFRKNILALHNENICQSKVQVLTMRMFKIKMVLLHQINASLLQKCKFPVMAE